MSGWISLHRKIQNHWIWQEKPFDKRSAWFDLILLANYKDNKFLLGNELIEVKRGSLIISELKLMERWGWSKTKVRNFLKLLEEDNMIIKKSDTKKTTLTIVNYSDYQDVETAKRPQEDHEKTTKEPPKDQKKTTKKPVEDHKKTAKELRKDTTNKDNKDNKENNIIMTPQEVEYISVLEKITNYPLDRKKDLDYMKELEKRYPKLDLVEAITKFSDWILDNPFKQNANHRSQINTSFSKYLEWGQCLKKEKKSKRPPLKMVINENYLRE
ncbi:hypothetical protein GOQ29_10110 [Clostridium sp. D2Q-14]|uniref:hypothetical protein n=1 Tax=Anaeromonas gelatinilytica TaxID=2683194 RepID=UPI00193B99E3|nr:hypothetical protein [Anaeromonas gelatinilytica]MBS4535965.1 hypothetical protein [Anaeromonas gelatinilytica]